MSSRKLIVRLSTILLTLILIPSAMQAVTVPKWGLFELRVTGSGTYMPPFYPSMTATFTDSNGNSLTVAGAGDSITSGMPQAKFIVRFTPTVPGLYTYVTSSSTDAGLNGLTGSFTCTLPAAATNHGFLRRDPNFPDSFIYDDGTRPFLWGQTYYEIVTPARYGTLSDWRTGIDQSFMKGILKVRLLISPWTTDPRYLVASQPFPKNGSSFVFSPLWIVPEHWAALDAVIAYLQSKGMVAEIILFRDPGPEGNFYSTQSDNQAFVRYVAARYAAYTNVIWSLSNEYQNADPSTASWDDLGCVMKGCNGYTAADPWIALSGNYRGLTVHPKPALCFTFFGHNWPVNASLQWHKTTSDSDLPNPFPTDQKAYDSIACNRRSDSNSCPPLATKDAIPMTNDEYGYFGVASLSQTQHRWAIWGLFTGGGFGTAGDARGSNPPIDSAIWASQLEYADINTLVHFVGDNHVPFWNMSPQTPCQTVTRVHVLAEPVSSATRQYVIYAALGGSFSVQLGAGTYQQVRFNPRAGGQVTLGNVTSTGGNVNFTMPDSNDWAIWLKKI